MCVYPGVVYALENWRHMPGYPKIATIHQGQARRQRGGRVAVGTGRGWSGAKTSLDGDDG